MAPFERAMVVSYNLSIVIVALYVPFGRNLRSNVFDAQINMGMGHLGPKIPGVPLRVDPRCLGLQRTNIIG